MKKKIIAIIAVAAILVAAIGSTLAYLTDKTDDVKNTFTLGQVKIKLDEAKVDENGEPEENADRVKENTYHLIPGETYTKDPTVTVLKGSEPCYVRIFVKVEAEYTLDQVKKYLTPEVLATHPELTDDIQTLIQKGYIVPVEGGSNYKIDPAKVLALITGWQESNWTREGTWVGATNGSRDPHKVIFEYRYVPNGGIVVKNDEDDTKLPALFTGFTYPDFVTNDIQDFLRTILEQEATANQDEDGYALLPWVDFVAQAIQAQTFENEANAWDAAGIPAGYEHEAAPITNPEFPMPIPTP